MTISQLDSQPDSPSLEQLLNSPRLPTVVQCLHDLPDAEAPRPFHRHRPGVGES